MPCQDYWSHTIKTEYIIIDQLREQSKAELSPILYWDYATLTMICTIGWPEKQKMWNINCAHADSVDIHKIEGSYPATFHFNTIGE